LIASLKTEFPIKTLNITDDQDFLVAFSGYDSNYENKSVAYWPLEKNEDAFRINVSLKGITNCYVTPDNQYLATMNNSKNLAIWNI